MAAFAITTPSTDLRLDGNRKAETAYTVTNTSHRNLRVRGSVVVEAAASESWFTVIDPKRDAPVDSTQQFNVRVAVPAEVAGGRYRFRLDVVDTENPDDFSAAGPWMSLQVPLQPQVRRAVPWLWIGVATAAVLISIGGLLSAWWATHLPTKGDLQVPMRELAFDNTRVGTVAGTKQINVSNSGAGNTRVLAYLSGSTAFSIGRNSCTARLSVNANCNIDLVFKPEAIGPVEATLTLSGDNIAASRSIHLVGVGTPVVDVALCNQLSDQIKNDQRQIEGLRSSLNGLNPLYRGNDTEVMRVRSAIQALETDISAKTAQRKQLGCT
jgi:hypothetical protein